jgi:hypothetical protein
VIIRHAFTCFSQTRGSHACTWLGMSSKQTCPRPCRSQVLLGSTQAWRRWWWLRAGDELVGKDKEPLGEATLPGRLHFRRRDHLPATTNTPALTIPSPSQTFPAIHKTVLRGVPVCWTHLRSSSAAFRGLPGSRPWQKSLCSASASSRLPGWHTEIGCISSLASARVGGASSAGSAAVRSLARPRTWVRH